MPKILAIAVFSLLCVPCALSQSKSVNTEVMSDAEYKIFLSQIEIRLPKWQLALKSIDPEKAPHLSYSQGKAITDAQTVALTEIDALHGDILLQHFKRTLDGEFSLMMLLHHLFDESREVMWRGAMNGLPSGPLQQIDEYGPQINSMSNKILEDIQGRVRINGEKPCK